MMTLTRRGLFGFFGLTGATALATAAGCSSENREDTLADKADSPVTISHLFGETTIPEPPKRVVCAGYTGSDDLLAVGVVPIAVTNWFGDQPFGVWPWAHSRLGDAKPVVLNLDNGIPIEQIAGLKPDLIVATNAGVDEGTYQKLSAIAPTLPQSDGDAFFEPWKEQATVIGRAVFQAQQMQSLIDGVDAKFRGVATDHPAFKDKTALLLHGRLDHGNVITTTGRQGWRTEFLTQMGLVVADQPDVIDRERIKSVLPTVDILIWTTENDEEKAALLTDTDIAAVQRRSVFTTGDQAGAIAYASPLSWPVVADQLPGPIAAILG